MRIAFSTGRDAPRLARRIDGLLADPMGGSFRSRLLRGTESSRKGVTQPGGAAVTNLTLTLDDAAAAPLPSAPPLTSGTFQPTNSDGGDGDDIFPSPAPTPSGNSLLSVFDGGNPNGTWQLFVVDDFGPDDPGRLAAGWPLQITAEVDVQVQEQVKIKKDKKKRKKGKGKH